MKLIDTHCHLDMAVFDEDRAQVVSQAIASGVQMMVVPAVAPKNWVDAIILSQQHPQCSYALGMHPMIIDQARPNSIAELDNVINKTLQVQNKLVAIGEIGLDYFVTKKNKETQEHYFSEQLKIAKQYNLPVILHVRHAIDDVLKHLRRIKVRGGIAHAFNGSMQQAEAFISLGFKLGFGGTMTYPRATKIRQLAKNLPIESIVLETDSPDMPPEWIDSKKRNSPKELLKIANVLAELRGIPVSQIIEITSKNSVAVLPKLGDLCTRVEALH